MAEAPEAEGAVNAPGGSGAVRTAEGEAASAAEEKSYTRGVMLLLTVATFDAMEYGLIMPSLYGYLEEATGREQSTLYGVILAAFSISSLCTRPFLGAWADAQGFVVVYAVTISIAIIGNVVYSFGTYAGSVLPILFGRILSGVGCANTSMVYAYISRCVPDKKRSRITQLAGFGFVFGLMLGPGTNAITGALDFTVGDFRINENNSPSLLVAALMVVQCIAIVSVLREPPPYAARVSLVMDARRVEPDGSSGLELAGAADGPAQLGVWELLPHENSAGASLVQLRWAPKTKGRPVLLGLDEEGGVALIPQANAEPAKCVWELRCAGDPALSTAPGPGAQERRRLRLLLGYLRGEPAAAGSDTALPAALRHAASGEWLGGGPRCALVPSESPCIIVPEETPQGQRMEDLREIFSIMLCEGKVFVSVAIIFGFNLKIGATEALLVPITKHAFGWDALYNSFVYGGMAVQGLILNMLMFTKVLPALKDQERWVVLIGQLIYAGGLCMALFLWTFEMPVWHFVLAYAVLMASLPFVFAPNRAIFSRIPSVARSRHQALLSQLLSVFASLGSITGPLWLSATFDENDSSDSGSNSTGSGSEQTGPIATVTLIGLGGLTILNSCLITVSWFLMGNPIDAGPAQDTASVNASPASPAAPGKPPRR
eukprot:TRINITY_DN51019_c0_g1_i1.p1 TRINITY_DN51019_c0_g1~~TRINITY_DN51019_c0_g1_i1.p1  ORF type:complete len:659 (+),score=189.83 TRINITY_DN51019_c0_g1_i1:74-2050(+)